MSSENIGQASYLSPYALCHHCIWPESSTALRQYIAKAISKLVAQELQQSEAKISRY